MIGQTVSHYRILRRLGEGGMGVIYLAEDTYLGRQVVLKFLNRREGRPRGEDESDLARFRQEARALSSLSHPNIATVYDYGETEEGQPFIVMELIRGQTLGELMAGSALTVARSVELIEKVAVALAEAHRRGIVHRDVKPSNIMVDEGGAVKVLDFGLAKLVGADGPPADSAAPTLMAVRTTSGAVIGTPLYLSPEQALAAPVDARSDIFSLGSVLYECLSGRPAFAGASVSDICARIIRDDPPPPSLANPRVPKALDRVALKALRKRPEERQQSADELIRELRAALGPRTGGADAPTRPLPRPAGTQRARALATLSNRLRRPRAWLPLAAAALLFAAAYWAWSAWPAPVPRQAADRFDEGVKAVRDGTYFKAAKMLEDAVAIDGRFALAHARLAEAWLELDYSEKAKDEQLRAQALLRGQTALGRLLARREDSLYVEAVDATVRRDFAAAAKLYEEAARSSPDKPYAYLDLGRAYEKADEADAAMANYQKAADLDPQYAPAFLRLGVLKGRRGDFGGAAGLLDRAAQLYDRQSDDEAVAEVRFQRGVLLNRQGRLDEARAEFRSALDAPRANEYQRVRALLKLSSIDTKQGQAERARQSADEAVGLARQEGMENLATDGLIDVGNADLSRRDYAEAEARFRQALDFARREQGRHNEARALLALASLSNERHDPAAVRRYVEQALPFYKLGGYRTEFSQANVLLGLAADLTGDYDLALQSFASAEQSGSGPQAALAQVSAGVVLLHQEKYTDALRSLDLSFKSYQALGQQRQAAYGLVHRADALWRLGRSEEARAALDDASSLISKTGEADPQLANSALLIRAQMALSQALYGEAAVAARQALDAAEQAGPAPGMPAVAEAERTLCLAQALSGKGAGAARQACERALAAAQEAGEPYIISGARLALAEALLAGGDARGALDAALAAREAFARAGQADSEWHSLAVAALACQRLGDAERTREYASQAADALGQLRERWGEQEFAGYLNRPDVTSYRQKLDRLSAPAQQGP